MLEGIDPVIVVQFKKTVTTPVNPDMPAIPIPEDKTQVNLPLIPIYLSGSLTGILIDTAEKSIDVETDTETSEAGGSPQLKQKGLNSTVKITLKAQGDSVGATLLSALMDQIFQKVTSKEYSITFVYGSTTVFNALLHSFNVNTNSDNDLQVITLELTASSVKTETKPKQPTVSAVRGSTPEL